MLEKISPSKQQRSIILFQNRKDIISESIILVQNPKDIFKTRHHHLYKFPNNNHENKLNC
jgi:hypothetical protein